MRSKLLLVLCVLISLWPARAQTLSPSSAEPSLEKFHPAQAPSPSGLLLKRGDRLAICGDSITEQKRYSRIMEDYLTMCVPELKVSVRQYGWSGEKAPGFLARMTNDCLRFKPSVATTCYGMNDHEYRAYLDRIGAAYLSNSLAIVEAFKANGVRVVQGSPGCVGKVPNWHKGGTDTTEDLNLNLCNLRNIGIDVANQEKVRFADVFWPMLAGGVAAQKLYGTNYTIAGKDGVHPDWAGHTVMAYAFLKALGLNGELGVFTVNLGKSRIKVSRGHEVVSARDGTFVIRSSQYLFCPCLPEGLAAVNYPVCVTNDLDKDSTIRSGMTLVPFSRDLNRLMLVAKNGKAPACRVTWGSEVRTLPTADLARGINLAEVFPHNPFGEAFAKVDAAIAAKQDFETRQIKKLFRSPEAKTNMTAVLTESEKEHARLVAAVESAFIPVTHTLKIEAQ